MTYILETNTVKSQLGITESQDDTTIQRLIKVVDGFLSSKMNRVLIQQSKVFKFDGEGDDSIFINQYPASFPTYGTDSFVKISGDIVHEDRLLLDESIGKVQLESGVFPCGKMNIEVKTSIGWSPDDVPEEVKHIAFELVSAMLSQHKVSRYNAGVDDEAPVSGVNGSKVVKSEREGDVQVTYEYVNLSGASKAIANSNPSAIDSMLSPLAQETLSMYTITKAASV